MLVYKPTY